MVRQNAHILKLIPVQRALALGWTGQERNLRAKRHFYFDGPCDFSVHVYGDFVTFTVGNQSTSYEPRVILLLEAQGSK